MEQALPYRPEMVQRTELQATKPEQRPVEQPTIQAAEIQDPETRKSVEYIESMLALIHKDLEMILADPASRSELGNHLNATLKDPEDPKAPKHHQVFAALSRFPIHKKAQELRGER